MLHQNEFQKAVLKHSDMVFRIAYSWLQNTDDANDVSQDVFMHLYLTDTAFESEEHLRNWLVRVTINQCKKIFRTPWNCREDIDLYLNQLACEKEDYQELYLAITKLDKKYRIPILLYYIEGYSTREIADILSIGENTVSTRLRRAREKLRDYLKEDEP